MTIGQALPAGDIHRTRVQSASARLVSDAWSPYAFEPKARRPIQIDHSNMPDPLPHLSPASCQAARELLLMSLEDLAKLAEVSVFTLRRFELGDDKPSHLVARRIQAALDRQGILFVGLAHDPQLK